jgi:hypothetical protein
LQIIFINLKTSKKEKKNLPNMAYSWAAAAGIDDESVPIPAAGVAAWAVVDDLRHEANREQSD